MPEWTVRVVAQKGFMGDSNDWLVWHFLSQAPSAEQAVALTRRDPAIPFGAEITATPGRMA